MKLFSQKWMMAALLGLCALPVAAQDTVTPRAGELVVFTLDSIRSDSVTVSLNGRFIAALQKQNQFATKLCEGKYELRSGYILPHTGPNNNVIRISSQRSIYIEPDETTFIELVSMGSGFQLRQVSRQDWEVKTMSGKLTNANFTRSRNALLSRVPAEAKCK